MEEPKGNLSAPKVLIVDDTTVVRKLIRAVLRDEPVEIVAVASGQDALTKIATTEFALVILDMNMPGMNGLEVAKQVLAQHATKLLPILFCTAVADKDVIVDATKLGTIDYIIKPINMENLLLKVRQILGYATRASKPADGAEKDQLLLPFN